MRVHAKHGKYQQRIVNAFTLVAIVAICSVLVQCNDDDAINTGKNDYYPLREDSSWEMLSRMYSQAWDGSYDTVLFRIDGDTIINGLTYKKLFAGDLAVQLLRKDRGKYYARDVWDGRNFSEEFLFLDEDAFVNTTWFRSSSFRYKVIAVNSIHTVNGITYENVIEMEFSRLDYYGKPEVSSSIYYAKGIGEIYGSFQYPLSGVYADIEKSLIKYTP